VETGRTVGAGSSLRRWADGALADEPVRREQLAAIGVGALDSCRIAAVF
jgi:hypothetical protein